MGRWKQSRLPSVRQDGARSAPRAGLIGPRRFTKSCSARRAAQHLRIPGDAPFKGAFRRYLAVNLDPLKIVDGIAPTNDRVLLFARPRTRFPSLNALLVSELFATAVAVGTVRKHSIRSYKSRRHALLAPPTSAQLPRPNLRMFRSRVLRALISRTPVRPWTARAALSLDSTRRPLTYRAAGGHSLAGPDRR